MLNSVQNWWENKHFGNWKKEVIEVFSIMEQELSRRFEPILINFINPRPECKKPIGSGLGLAFVNK
jgi:hypothetical protein